MIKNLLFLLGVVATFWVKGAPKSVKLANASKDSLNVCVYMSSTVDDLGVATKAFVTLAPNGSENFDYGYQNGRFIHAVVILPSGDAIITNSLQASGSDRKEVAINIVKPVGKAIDRPEMERMRKLVDDELVNFSRIYIKSIPVTGSNTLGIQEYLGSIVIIDTAEVDMRKAIKLSFSARQLGISDNPQVAGRSFSESFNISKDFGAEASASFPTAFSTKLNFSNSDLLEVKLVCTNIGTAPLVSRPGSTPITSLLELNEKTNENIIGAVTATLDTCKTCILQQIEGVLAHDGIAVIVKRYKKSKLIITSNVSSSVVTANGAYSYENLYDYVDVIAPKVIALGISGKNLKTLFAQAILLKLKSQRSELDAQRKDQQLAIVKFDKNITEIDAIITKLEKF